MKTTTGADEIIFSIRTFSAWGSDDDDAQKKACEPDARNATCVMTLTKPNICNKIKISITVLRPTPALLLFLFHKSGFSLSINQ